MLLKIRKIITSSIIKNGLGILLARLTILFSSAFTTVILIRYLDGVDTYGSFSVACGIYAICLNLALFGLGNVLTREVAKRRDLSWKYFIQICYLGLFLTLFTTVVAFLVTLYMGYSKLILYSTVILLLGLLPNFVIFMSEALFVGLEKVKYFTYVNFMYTLLEAIFIFAFLISHYGIFFILSIMVCARYLSAITFWIIITKKVVKVGEIRLDFIFIKGILKIAPIFAAVGFLAGFLFKIDILFLSKLVGVYETGLYAAAYKFVNLWCLVLTSFISVFYPVASKYYSKDKEKFKTACHVMIKWLIIVLNVAIIFTLCLGDKVIPLLFREEYTKAIPILNWLIFLVIPLCGTSLFGLILAASNKQKYDLYAVLTAVLSSILLHYYLVKQFSYFGSVIATIISFSIILIFQAIFIYKNVFEIEFSQYIVKPLLLLIVTSFMLYFFKEYNWLLKLLSSFIIVIIYFFSMNLFDKKELSILDNMEGEQV